MPNFITRALRPEIYHGHNQAAPFFEGWYFKLVSADGERRLAVIPGVFLGDNGHAFIQVLDGASQNSDYVSFPLVDFWASQDDFDIRIGDNHFTVYGFSLDIKTSIGHIKGMVSFEDPVPWPVTLTSPGIMGWYAWVPRMECYHGVLSFDHRINGTITKDGNEINFTGGRGYIEKDWGQAFPDGYIWFQSNHFTYPGWETENGETQRHNQPERVSLTASVAIIPWIRQAFRGFIVGLWIDGTLYRFATYSGAVIEHLALSEDQVVWRIRDKRYRLHMTVHRAPAGAILGPTRQEMGVRVDETISASVDVQLSTVSGEILFSGTGHHTGLEVQGNLDRLLAI